MKKIQCLLADSFWRRLIGLSGTKKIPSDPLFIPNCRSVHTFGMQFPLNLVWFDRDFCIIRIDRQVKPGTIKYCPQASHVVEYPSIWDFGFQVKNQFALILKNKSVSPKTNVGAIFVKYRSPLDFWQAIMTQWKNPKNAGQTVVEAAFVFPLLFLVVFGFLQLSLAITEKQKLYHVVHYAVQAGSLSNDDAQITGAIEEYYNPGTVTVAIESRDGDNDQIISATNRHYNDKITVQIDRDFTFTIPFLDIALSDITATASARVLCNELTAPYICE